MLEVILRKAIQEKRPIRIYSHKNPDGDAVSSAKTLERFFREQGIDAKYIVRDKPNNFFSDILGQTYSTREFIPQEAISIILDTSKIEHVENPSYKFSFRKNTYIIDHHEKPKNNSAIEDALHIFPKNVLRYPNASSTCEIIGKELYKMKKLNPDYSTMLLVGMSTDTGSFRYLQPRTLQNLKMFLKAGGNLKKVQSITQKKKPLKTEVGLAKVFKKLSRISIGNTYLNYLGLSYEEAQELQKKYNISNPQKAIYKLSSIEDTSLNVFASENKPNMLSCEFRSISFTGNVNVFKIADAHGGGGHYNASGCIIPTNGDIASTTRSLLEELTSYALDTLVNFKPQISTENDKTLHDLLSKIDFFNGATTLSDIDAIQELLSTGNINYLKTYENQISIKKFMLRNEILSLVPDDSLESRKLNISLDDQFINEMKHKYDASLEDIKDATDVFDEIDIDSICISLPNQERISLDYKGLEKDTSR